MDQELTEQFNESMRQLTEMMAQLNSTMAGTVKSMNDASTAGKTAAATAKQNSDSQTNSTNQVVTGNTKLQEAQKKSSDIMAESAKNFAAAGFLAGNALKSFGSALTSTEEGFKKYGASFNSLGDSALTLGRNFGVLGNATGLVAKAFGAIAEKAFTQSDNLLKASDDIARLGAANTFSTSEIYKMGHQLGLTSAQLNKMTGPMKKIGDAFGMMGNGASDATKQFVEMTTSTAKVRAEFRRMGYNDEERIEAQAKFVESMNKSGISVRNLEKTSGGLQKISQEYIKNLTELASISGSTVEAERTKQEAAMANIQFQTYLNRLDLEMRNAKTQAEKDEVKKKIDAARLAVSAAKETGGDVGAASMAQRIMMGFTNIGVAQQAVLGTMDLNQQLADKAKAGELSNLEKAKYVDEARDKMRTNIDLLGEAISLSPDLANGLDLSLNLITDLNANAGRSQVEALENDRKAKAALAAKGPDPLQVFRDNVAEAEKKLSLAFDDLVRQLSPTLNSMLKGAMDGLIKAFDFVKNNFDSIVSGLKAFTVTLGIASVALAAIKTRGMFDSLKDLFKGRQGSKGNPMYVKMAGSDETSGPAERAARKKSSAIDESKLLDTNGKPLTGAARSSRMAKLERDAASALGKTSKLAKIGTILGKTTTALAVVGSAVSAYSDWSDISAQANAGEISQQEATKRKAEAVGGAGGAAAGGAAGAALGSMLLPGIGTVLGGMLGTALGEKLGKAGADKLTGVIDTAMAPLSSITAGIGSTIDSLKPAVTWITKAFTDVSGIMFSISKLVFFPFYWAGLKVSEGFKKISSGISNWLKEHPKVVAAVKWIGEGLSWLGDLIKRLFGGIGDTLSSWNKGLSDWVGSLYGEDETKQQPNKARTAPAGPAKPAQSESGWLSWLTGSPDADTGQKSQIREEAKSNSDKVVKSAAKNTTSSEKTEKATVVFSKSTTKFTDQITTLSRFIEMQSKSIKDFSSSVLTFKDTISDLKNYVDTNLLGGYGTQFGGDVDRILATIRQRESSGDYKAEAKGSSASGAYQFIDSTWQSLTKKYNIGTEFKRAMDAPNAVQDQVASAYVQDILKQSGGDVSKVPLAWYTGNIQGKMSQSALAANRGLTPQMYQQKWMEDFSKTRPSGAASGQSSGIIALGRSLQSQGFRVDEHPAFLPYNPGAHKGKGHAEGRAIDVNIGKGVNEATDPEAGARMDALAQQLASDPNLTVLWRQAGHFDHMHVESKRGVQAAKGGVFAGSRAGYPATLHGTEMVAPLNLDSVLMKLAKTSSSTPEGQELLGETKKIAGTGASDIDKVTLFNKEIAGMITSKLDKMIDILDDGNNTRHKILQHSRT